MLMNAIKISEMDPVCASILEKSFYDINLNYFVFESKTKSEIELYFNSIDLGPKCSSEKCLDVIFNNLLLSSNIFNFIYRDGHTSVFFNGCFIKRDLLLTSGVRKVAIGINSWKMEYS